MMLLRDQSIGNLFMLYLLEKLLNHVCIFFVDVVADGLGGE